MERRKSRRTTAWKKAKTSNDSHEWVDSCSDEDSSNKKGRKKGKADCKEVETKGDVNSYCKLVVHMCLKKGKILHKIEDLSVATSYLDRSAPEKLLLVFVVLC